MDLTTVSQQNTVIPNSAPGTTRSEDCVLDAGLSLKNSKGFAKFLPIFPKAVRNYYNFLSSHNLADNMSSAALYQVHEDLRLIRGWSNLRVSKSPRLSIFGVAAPGFDSIFPDPVDETNDRMQAVVPVPTEAHLTPRILAQMCTGMRHPDTNGELRCITVAIVDRDSTTAYYRVFERFDEIIHPQWKQKKPRTPTANSLGANGSDFAEDNILMTGNSSSSGSGSPSDSGSDSDEA
jgi:Sen15 protein